MSEPTKFVYKFPITVTWEKIDSRVNNIFKELNNTMSSFGFTEKIELEDTTVAHMLLSIDKELTRKQQSEFRTLMEKELRNGCSEFKDMNVDFPELVERPTPKCKKCLDRGFLYSGNFVFESDGNWYRCPNCDRECGMMGHVDKDGNYNCPTKPCPICNVKPS